MAFPDAPMMMQPGLTAKDCPNNNTCGTISQLSEEEIELIQVREIELALACERIRVNQREAAILMLRSRGAMPSLDDFKIQESIDIINELLDSLSPAIASLYKDYVAPPEVQLHQYSVTRPWGVYYYNKLASDEPIFRPAIKNRMVKVIHVSKKTDARYIEAFKGICRRNRLIKINSLLEKARDAIAEAVELIDGVVVDSSSSSEDIDDARTS